MRKDRCLETENMLLEDEWVDKEDRWNTSENGQDDRLVKQHELQKTAQSCAHSQLSMRTATDDNDS